MDNLGQSGTCTTIYKFLHANQIIATDFSEHIAQNSLFKWNLL